MKIKIEFSKKEKSKILITKNINIIEKIKAELNFDKYLIITDKNILHVFKNRIDKDNIYLLSNSRNKEIKEVFKIIKQLIKHKFTRDSILIALGGGKTSDITGFTASIYMRGIKWVCVPTTMLSAIDASIGGKNAVDLENIKNIIGSFYNPSLTLINSDFTETQNDKNFFESSGELLKYILISDKKTRENILKLIPGYLKREKESINKIIYLCLKHKSDIIKKDMYDEKGIREILNFGHTSAHAIEKIHNLPHGYSVFLGIKYAVELSRKLNLINQKNYNNIKNLINLFNINIKLKNKQPNKFIKLINMDKKKRKNQNYFILIKKPGTLVKAKNIKNSLILKTYTEL